MKPDGVTMETTEPTEAVVGTEPLSTEAVAVQAEDGVPALSSPNEGNETATAPPTVPEAKAEPNVLLKGTCLKDSKTLKRAGKIRTLPPAT